MTPNQEYGITKPDQGGQGNIKARFKYLSMRLPASCPINKNVLGVHVQSLDAISAI